MGCPSTEVELGGQSIPSSSHSDGSGIVTPGGDIVGQGISGGSNSHGDGRGIITGGRGIVGQGRPGNNTSHGDGSDIDTGANVIIRGMRRNTSKVKKRQVSTRRE